MVTWISIGAALAAAGILGAWWIRRTDQLGRPRQAPTISVSIVLVISLAAGFVSWRHERLEDRLSAAASALVGVPVKVDCQSWGGAMVDADGHLGYVKWGPDGVPERRTLIKRDVCNDLRGYLGSPGAGSNRDQVIAVHILSHESMHMAGEKSEAVTECRAVQRNAITARLLGASPEAAAALAATYWRDLYPNQTEEYRSRDCGPGGALDEHLADAPWTTSS
jgi:hypothetical protein